jgi:phage tail sheath protein FI
MPTYQAPGVYIEEIELGPPPITGVSTSTAGFIGIAEKGPVNRPMLVTGMGEFERIFGDRLASSFGDNRWLMYAAQGFFDNGGQTAYVVRVARLPEDLTADTDRTQFAWTARGVVPDRALAPRLLQSDADKDATSLDIVDTAGIAHNAVLVIGDGASAESVLVTGIADGVQVVPPLRNPHLRGTQIVVEPAPPPANKVGVTAAPTDSHPAGARAIAVADSSVAQVGKFFILSDAEGVHVAGVSGPVVDITPTPLLANRGLGTSAKLYDVTATTAQTSTSINHAATNTIDVPDGTAIAATDWVVLEPGTARSEAVHVTAADVPGGAPITLHLATTRFDHTTTPYTVTKLAQVVTTPVATTLTRPAALPLDTGGIATGTYVTWEADPTLREIVEIVGADQTIGGTHLYPLAAPLHLSHAQNVDVRSVTVPAGKTLTAAVPAGSTELALSDVGGLPAPDSYGYVVEIRDGPQTEFVHVTKVDTGAKRLILLGPTRNRHETTARVLDLSGHGALRINAGPRRPDPQKWPEVGEWGNRITILVLPATLSSTPLASSANANDNFLDVVTANGIYPGTLLRLPDNQFATVSRVSDKRVHLDAPITQGIDITLANTTPPKPWLNTVSTVEFTLTAAFGPAATEVFENLSLDPRHPRFVETVIDAANGSKLIRVESMKSKDPTQPPKPEDLPMLTDGWHPVGGSNPVDPSHVVQMFTGKETPNADDRTGIYAFLNVDGVSIIAAPGQTDPSIQGALNTHCELGKYTFAVLDSVKSADIDGVVAQRNLYDSKYAALYYPWLEIFDTLENKPTIAPPSGHVMGVYARTDTEVGVHQAPANQVVAGALDLEKLIGKAQQGVINPKGINAIRALPGRGIRIWGARTISSDALWRYVNVRRLFIFLEQSIDLSTQYAVFRPNDTPLWNGLKATVSAFLTSVWRSGALQGTTRDQAYFVRCGLGETMTQQDIDEGRVIILIGVAPTKPAEFVIFRIGQKAGGATVGE